jgi:hypothetical protein
LGAAFGAALGAGFGWGAGAGCCATALEERTMASTDVAATAASVRRTGRTGADDSRRVILQDPLLRRARRALSPAGVRAVLFVKYGISVTQVLA